MSRIHLPYEPVRSNLYSPAELFAGFDPGVVGSYQKTLDYRIYTHFKVHGQLPAASNFESMMQSLHDNSISQAVASCRARRKCVAIMGGHELSRKAGAFRDVAKLSCELARRGFLIVSGGGPGAMEAANLGALLKNEPDATVDEALAKLAAASDLPPHLNRIVDHHGKFNLRLLRALHDWFTPAYEIRRRVRRPGRSLSIPTWYYGHEPPTPFATDIAKYFQNSVREDGLVTIGLYGIIYAEGKSGTIQEIFQDACQNAYQNVDWFSPMVFLGGDYWTKTYPVVPVLQRLFPPADFKRSVLVTNHNEKAVRFISAFHPRKRR